MTLFELCNEIAIQSEIKTRVFDFANRFDFNIVGKQLKDFLAYEKMEEEGLNSKLYLAMMRKRSRYFLVC